MDFTHSHGLKIIFVTLTQFLGNHGFGLAHVINGSLDSDDAFKIKAVYVIDTANGDLSVSVLHNPLDCVSTFSDDTTDEVIVCKDLQGDFTVGSKKTKNKIVNFADHKIYEVFFLFFF